MAKIAIIGSGFVGQATGRGFAKRGHEVVFCDVKKKILVELRKQGYRTCFPDSLAKKDFDVFFISVFTPTIRRQVSFDSLREAAVNLGAGALKRSRKYCLVVARSTILPGTTENLIIPVLQEHSGKMAGRDFGVCFNPEFLREKSAQEDFDHPRLIMVGGLDQRSGETLEDFYASHFSCPIVKRTLLEAEVFKYMHNVANAAKISLVNELSLVCKKMGIDPMELLPFLAVSAQSFWDPSYGVRHIGHFGGSCLPKDAVGLQHWARTKLSLEMPLLSAVIDVNLTMIRSNGGLKSLPEKEAVY